MACDVTKAIILTALRVLCRAKRWLSFSRYGRPLSLLAKNGGWQRCLHEDEELSTSSRKQRCQTFHEEEVKKISTITWLRKINLMSPLLG